jgi:transcriptional regulator with XRE-family HTH domain
MDNISIKDNIRKIRKERQLTQEDLAHRLGISVTAYRDLEKGDTNIVNGNVLRLAELLETSTEEIVLGYRPVQMQGKKLEEIQEEYNGRVADLKREVEYLRKLVKSHEETIATKNQLINMLEKRLEK